MKTPETIRSSASAENSESLAVFYGNHTSNSRFANAKSEELKKWFI